MLRALSEHFDVYEKLPVPIRAVKDQLIHLGVQDEIKFHLVDIDTSKVRGMLYRYIRHAAAYGEPIFCSDICIGKEQSQEWKRLVAVKELLHITDKELVTAQSEDAVNKLLLRLSLPFEIQEETNSSLNDRVRIIPSLAILVPFECRRVLRDLRIKGKITDAEVAQIAKIPERYGKVVISEAFEGAVAAFSKT